MQIWKFNIPVYDFLVKMPIGARILSSGVQGDEIMVWALVDPDPSVEEVIRRLPVYGTGHEIAKSDQGLPFISTVFMGPLVFHVFDGGENGSS